MLYFFSLLFEQIRLIGSNLLKSGNCLSRLIWTSDGRCRCLSNIKSERILEKRKKKKERKQQHSLSLCVKRPFTLANGTKSVFNFASIIDRLASYWKQNNFERLSFKNRNELAWFTLRTVSRGEGFVINETMIMFEQAKHCS